MKIYSLDKRKSEQGFALPLVLSLSAVIAGLLLSGIKVSITNNATSRIRLLASLANTSLETLINNYRALLNDSTNGNLLSYFWVVQGCSTNQSRTPSNCPKELSSSQKIPPTGVQRPDLSFWDDSDFCKNSSGPGCLGRQIAPKCNYFNPNSPYPTQEINWYSLTTTVNSYFNTIKDLSRGQLVGGNYRPLGNIYTYTTIGQIEQGGRGQIDIVGLLKEGRNIKSERRATISMEIEKSTPYSGFAFIAAGQYQNDINAISISNLQTVGSPKARGSIYLRRNMNGWNRSNYLNPSSCGTMSNIFFNRGNFALPLRNDGGLMVHSLYWPTSAKIPSQAPTSAPPTRTVRFNERETISNSVADKKLVYRNLFVLRGATLFIETSAKNRVTLQVTDSIDVAPGAKICNVKPGSSVCGSGDPNNLTIVSTFKDYSRTNYRVNADDLGCSTPRGGEGTGEVYSARDPYSSRPGGTFTFRSTGGRSEKLSAFIYGKDMTFTSGGVYRGRRRTFMLDSSNTIGVNSSSLVIHRGRLSVTNLESPSDQRVWGLVSPTSRTLVINADDARSRQNRMNPGDRYLENKKIIAVAERTIAGDRYATYANSYIPQPIYITYDLNRDIFELHSARRLRSPSGPSAHATDGLIQLEQALPQNIQSAIGTIPRSFPSSQLSIYRNLLLRLYGVTIVAPNTNDMYAERLFSGAVWAHKVCFSKTWSFGDYLQRQKWEFDNKFVDGLTSYYGESFRLGFSNYKSRYLTSWDILRDFYN